MAATSSSFALTLQEELSLIRTYIYHTKREEQRLRRHLTSIESKIEQSRLQLRDILKFIQQHQTGIDVHLRNLSKTEHTIREQIDTIFTTRQRPLHHTNGHSHSNEENTDLNVTATANANAKPMLKQTKRAKKLNTNLMEIVYVRNEHELRLDSTQSTYKLIESLLDDETKALPMNDKLQTEDLLLELDDNITPCVSEYIYHRQEMTKIQKELVDCVKKRELANQAQYFTKLSLLKQMAKKCSKCNCACKCLDELLLGDSFRANHTRRDDEQEDNDNDIESDDDDFVVSINRDILKSELIQLGQDIHQRSGLIRQQRRDGMCHVRVFVGSELITWMVKSDIVETRYEATILASLLLDAGYVYCAYESSSARNHLHSSSATMSTSTTPTTIISTSASASSSSSASSAICSSAASKNPSISLKRLKAPSSLLSDASSQPQPSFLLQLPKSPRTPNKLLLAAPASPAAAASLPDAANLHHNPNQSAPSSVISGASSISAISGISGTSSSTYSNQTTSSSSGVSSQHAHSLQITSMRTCSCKCTYCMQANKAKRCSFQDTNNLYRFRCDDSRIERVSKMGWLEKFGRFRSKKRHFIWDGVRRQLREYKTKGDTVPIYKYPFNRETQINASKTDQCVLMIAFFETGQTSNPHVLKLKAANLRERDAWIRVLRNDNSSTEEAAATPAQQTSGDHYSYSGDLSNHHNENEMNYEEYRHLRMTNRLKWSSLFISLKATSRCIQSFREFMLRQSKLQKCDKAEIEKELIALFTNKQSPICVLFHSFHRLFLEPFYKININELELDSVDSIISLCVDDLSSFLAICQTRLSNLLLPSSLRGSSANQQAHRPQPAAVVKLLQKLVKKWIYTQCFTSSVYNTIFPLYQRVHHHCDQQLYDIALNARHFATKHYLISEELQIDQDWVKHKNTQIQDMLGVMSVHNEHVNGADDHNDDDDDDDNHDILTLDSLQFNQAKNNIVKLMSSKEEKAQKAPAPKPEAPIVLESPFQPCIEKFYEMTYCTSPIKKLECLVELHQSIIKCIDQHRQAQFNKALLAQQDQLPEEKEKEEENNNDDDVDVDDDDDIVSVEFSDDDNDHQMTVNMNRRKRRTHGIIAEDDDDDDDDEMNVSLVSYESATSEYWTQQSSKQEHKSAENEAKRRGASKCKRLLIASDDMIPLFCYVLVQSQIQSVNAEIAFMNDFMNEEEKQMKIGFYLTTLQAATSTLMSRKLPTRNV